MLSCGYIGRRLREEASDEELNAELLKLPLYPDTAQEALDTWHRRTIAVERILVPHSYGQSRCRIWSRTLTKYTELPLEDE